MALAYYFDHVWETGCAAGDVSAVVSSQAPNDKLSSGVVSAVHFSDDLLNAGALKPVAPIARIVAAPGPVHAQEASEAVQAPLASKDGDSVPLELLVRHPFERDHDSNSYRLPRAAKYAVVSREKHIYGPVFGTGQVERVELAKPKPLKRLGANPILGLRDDNFVGERREVRERRSAAPGIPLGI